VLGFERAISGAKSYHLERVSSCLLGGSRPPVCLLTIEGIKLPDKLYRTFPNAQGSTSRTSTVKKYMQ